MRRRANSFEDQAGGHLWNRAFRSDFEDVVSSMVAKEVDPSTYITHRVSLEDVAQQFPS